MCVLGPYLAIMLIPGPNLAKECKNEEIRDYAVKYKVSNVACNTLELIKEKLELRFGKTEDQKDREIMTKFNRSQLIGNIGDLS